MLCEYILYGFSFLDDLRMLAVDKRGCWTRYTIELGRSRLGVHTCIQYGDRVTAFQFWNNTSIPRYELMQVGPTTNARSFAGRSMPAGAMT